MAPRNNMILTVCSPVIIGIPGRTRFPIFFRGCSMYLCDAWPSKCKRVARKEKQAKVAIGERGTLLLKAQCITSDHTQKVIHTKPNVYQGVTWLLGPPCVLIYILPGMYIYICVRPHNNR